MKDTISFTQSINKESKKAKKKNDILAQIGKLFYLLFYLFFAIN